MGRVWEWISFMQANTLGDFALCLGMVVTILFAFYIGRVCVLSAIARNPSTERGLLLQMGLLFLFPHHNHKHFSDRAKIEKGKGKRRRSIFFMGSTAVDDWQRHDVAYGDHFAQEVILATSLSMIYVLQLPDEVAYWLWVMFSLLTALRLVSPLTTSFEAIIHDLLETDEIALHTSKAMSHFLSSILQFLGWGVYAVTLFHVLGFDTSAFVSGLGITSLSIGFALQSVLKDVFASMSLIYDRRFDVDNKITVLGHDGHVQNVGLFTTKIRLVKDGQLLFVPNNTMITTPLINHASLPTRRVEFKFTIAVSTPPALFSKLLEGIKYKLSTVDGVSDVHVCLSDIISTSGIEVQVVYHYSPGDNDAAWKISKTTVITRICQQLEVVGVSMAGQRSELVTPL